MNSFASEFSLNRCDMLFGCNTATYVNTALNCHSHLDYFLFSDASSLLSFNVFDDGSNVSDHLPILLRFSCAISSDHCKSVSNSTSPQQTFLRWDHGDRNSYYAKWSKFSNFIVQLI